jgi:hypothetical protein
MFNRLQFEINFTASIDALQQSENVTKRELKVLSRSVLEAHHSTGDIVFINKLVSVLTPVNKKVAIIFFKAFSGFQWDDQNKVFTKKSKKGYDKAHTAYVEFMADPNNNIWSWAERNVEVEPKPFDVSKVTTFIKSALKKAEQRDVLKAVLDGGIDADTLFALIEELGMAEVNVEKLPDAPF